MMCRPNRRGFTLIEFFIVVFIIATVWAIAVPNFPTCRRDGVRECWADQKALIRAREYYALDRNLSATDVRLTPQTIEQLIAAQYFTRPDPRLHRALPELPYALSEDGLTLVCPRHGVRDQPWHLSPREHLLEQHVTEARLLELAQDNPLSSSARRAYNEARLLHALGWACVSAMPFLVVWLIRRAGRRQPRAKQPGKEERPILDGLNPPRAAHRPAPLPVLALRIDRVGPELARPRCPVCATTCDAVLAVVLACGSCGVPHHRDCLEYFGRCGIYGCAPVLSIA